MRISLYQFVIGCLLVFVVSCQPKIIPDLTDVNRTMPSIPYILSKLEARQSAIYDIKAFIRTNISGENFNQSFRQAILIKGDDALRVDTYNLFRQVLGSLIYEGGETLMYDPGEEKIILGEEVRENMRRVLGTYIDFRQYIIVFSGGIPNIAHLQGKTVRLNSDKTVYQIEMINKKTRQKVDITVEANTLLLKSLILTQGDQEAYRVYWSDYKKVDSLSFAHKVVVKSKKKTVSLKYSDVMINQGITSNAFSFAAELMN
jgi:outer membrane lipoprotein-sorting protein